jgi:exosortase
VAQTFESVLVLIATLTALGTKGANRSMRLRWVVAFTSAALAVCYGPTLRGMFGQWWNDEDMGHGFVVPLVVLWIIWRERERWRNLSAKPNWWGVAMLAAGACFHTAAALGGGLFAGSLAFLISVSGAVLCLGGSVFLRAWAFPLLLTIFMLPKLAIVYNQATLPLQLLASRSAAAMLTLAGIGVVREGNILDVAGHRVAVAEACNGIRYLLPLGFTALVFAYLADSKPWMRIALLAAAVPISILANAFRVAASACVPALDAGTPHAVSGWLIFVLCLLTLALLRAFINSMFTRFHA